MPLTITLRRIADDHAEACLGDQFLAEFTPSALLIESPLRQETADPVAYGQRLFAALGGPALATHLRTLPLAPDPASLLTIVTSDPDLAAIPWEYFHDGSVFVIFRYLFAREVPAAPLPAPPDPALPWRLVAMGSDPLLAADGKTLPRLRVEHELDRLRDAVTKQPLSIRWQRIAPTRQALIDDLATAEPILFHYAGHGDLLADRPVLSFDNGCGDADPQPAAELAATLRGQCIFAFLNACRTADSRQPEANLALTLVRNGIPAALGMQAPIADNDAEALAATFYRALAAGQPPAQALYRARLTLKARLRDQMAMWAIPALYLAQGYRWPTPPPAPPTPLPSLEPPAPNIAELRAPDQIIGRERELAELARLFVLDRRQIVTVRGVGGIGKTALVAALARRLRFHFSDGIFALSLVLPGEAAELNAAEVRRRLAKLLGVDGDEAFTRAADAETQENVLTSAAAARRQRLLIWDNYETVLWRLGSEAADTSFSPEQRAEAAAVQRLVRLLAERGVSLLFTTRQSPVGLPGETLYPPPERGQLLAGLHPADSERLLRQWAGARVTRTLRIS